jgi:hypothetical protein
VDAEVAEHGHPLLVPEGDEVVVQQLEPSGLLGDVLTGGDGVPVRAEAGRRETWIG